MIAPRQLVDARRTAELADPHDQRLIEQTALIEILQQRRQRLIRDGQQILLEDRVHGFVVETVRIPAALAAADEGAKYTLMNCAPASTSRRASRQP